MFSIGTNLDIKLFDYLDNKNVYEIYGKLENDAIGGGRASFDIIYPTSRRLLEKNVEMAHRRGVKFNYLLNASCLANTEYTKNGRRKIFKLLDYLSEIKVDTITVSLPYLLKIIKRNYPHFSLDVSTIAGVSTIPKLLAWLDLGADCITLDDTVANRDFDFLNKLAEKNIYSVKLLANQACNSNCISRNYHYNITSHNSQLEGGTFPVSYCEISCKLMKLTNLNQLLLCQWIRPEDLSVYEKMGFTKFKLVQRHDSVEEIVKTLNAYNDREWKGNLTEIVRFPFVSANAKKNKISFLHLLKHVFRPFEINLFKLWRLYSCQYYKKYDFQLYIDNCELNGFLEKFSLGECNILQCSECNHCQTYFKKAVTYDKEALQCLIKSIKEMERSYLDRNDSLFS